RLPHRRHLRHRPDPRGGRRRHRRLSVKPGRPERSRARASVANQRRRCFTLDVDDTAEYGARPWLRWYSARVPTEIEIPDVPLIRLLDDAARDFPRPTARAFLG